MQGVELPCDWTVNRRPTTGTKDSSFTVATTTKPSRKAHHAAQQPVATDSAPPVTEPLDNNNAIIVPDSFGAIVTNPLGPRTNFKGPPKDLVPLVSMLPNHGQVRKLVLQHLSTPATTEVVVVDPSPMNIVVDNLLSRLPYKKMLSDMFGGTLRGNLHNSQIPYITRAYEESFMREVQSAGERECARGQQCECVFVDRLQPFVGVEFLLPSEERPATPHLCVLCCRAITQQLYYDVMFDKADFPGVIQRFGNIHSEVGEYALDAMLIAAPSAPVHVMPLPIVSHQRNRYTVFVHGGIKRLRQTRVYFQATPSCNADSGQ